MIGICLDCFVEKGLTVTTTTDLCNANNLQNGGIYYYFDTKEEMVLACVEEAISRIEQGAFSIAFEDIKDVANSEPIRTCHRGAKHTREIKTSKTTANDINTARDTVIL